MGTPDFAFAALTALMLGLIGVTVARSSARLALVVVTALAAWLGLAAWLASTGALSDWTSRPPRLPLLPLAVLSTFALASRAKAFRELPVRTPPSWPIAAQTFRIAVEGLLYAFHADGRVPLQMTFEGRNVDILVGLTAPVVAWVVARRGAPRLALAWNLGGLAILSNTIGTAMTSTPGPLHLAWSGEPFTALAQWPLVWLPALLAPLAVALHVFSLRQTVAQLRHDHGRVRAALATKTSSIG